MKGPKDFNHAKFCENPIKNEAFDSLMGVYTGYTLATASS